MNGTALIAPSQGGIFYFDLVASASGAISGTVYSTRDSTGLLAGDIQCGTSFTSVWYGEQVYVGGKGGPEIPIHAKNGVTLNLNTVVPISSPLVVTAPTGDGTYLRLDAANSPETGNLSFTGNNTHSGTETFTGNVAGTQSFNGRVWAGPSGFKYTTLDSALADPLLSPSGSNYSQMDAAPGFTESGTVGLTIGNGGSQHINMTWFGPSIYSCPSGAAIDCFTLKSGSQMHCQMVGATSGGAGQGCIIQAPFTGSLNTLVSSDQTGTTNPYFRIEKMVLQAGQSGNFATMTNPCLRITNTAFMAVVNDVVVNACNGAGISVEANATGGSGQGPLNINNVWSDGFAKANAIPCQVVSTGGYVIPVEWNGGTCNHPGLNKPAFLANNNSGTVGQVRGLRLHTYAENLTASNNNLLYQFQNIFNVNMDGSVGFGQPGDTGIDLSQPAGAGNLCGFHVSPFSVNSALNSGNLLNNHVSGLTVLAATYRGLSFYNFPGDSSCPFAPPVFDSGGLELTGNGTNNPLHIYHSIDSLPPTNYSRFYVDPSGASVVVGTQHGGSGSAEGLVLNSDSGNTTIEAAGALEWQFSTNTLKCLVAAGACDIGTSTSGQQIRNEYIGGTIQSSNGSAATLTGTGACATFSGQVGGELAGSAACASVTAASTLTIGGLPAAAHGYSCVVQDETTRANLFQQTGHTTTSATFTITSVTQNDVFVWTACNGF